MQKKQELKELLNYQKIFFGEGEVLSVGIK